MREILVLGAGRSAPSMIRYLLEHAPEEEWQVTVTATTEEKARSRIGDAASGKGIALDLGDDAARASAIQAADLVISLGPPPFHPLVAQDCLRLGKHMVTASYVPQAMQKMSDEVEKAGLIFLNELGVDPGIDHMSAMRIINNIRQGGGELLRFESFTGGLVAPESDNNPWGYKVTWNPRNVVLAGQGSPASFLHEGRYKYIPYHRLFRRIEPIEIKGYGAFEGYANRDSIHYIDLYGLQGISTLYRGTLRRPGYCRAWDILVQLGATDDSYVIQDSENLTYRQFINTFLYYHPTASVEMKLMHYMHIDLDSDIMSKLQWLGIFEERKIGLKEATPAQILQQLIEEKWKLEPNDKDMIAMWHLFVYKQGESKKRHEASLVVLGDDPVHTAMAKTVGLPVAIATRLILNGTITSPGVSIPLSPEVYQPVLNELENYGVTFNDKIFDLPDDPNQFYLPGS